MVITVFATSSFCVFFSDSLPFAAAAVKVSATHHCSTTAASLQDVASMVTFQIYVPIRRGSGAVVFPLRERLGRAHTPLRRNSTPPSSTAKLSHTSSRLPGPSSAMMDGCSPNVDLQNPVYPSPVLLTVRCHPDRPSLYTVRPSMVLQAIYFLLCLRLV